MEQRHKRISYRLYRVGRRLTKKTVVFHTLLTCAAVSLMSVALNHVAFAASPTQIKPNQDVVTLEFEKSDHGMGRHFPLYTQGTIRYFSAGVGKKERQSQYPAFPLKLVFANDTGSFLAYVSVEIHNQDGSLAAKIPAKHVTAPWLFVDLESGVYEIVATNRDGEKVKKRVPIKENDPLSLPLYWNS